MDKILDAAADGTVTQESALRLIFLVRKAGEKGYVWWKRTSLAQHWNVHKTTITRDYEQWSERGFVKLRSNPFKASAKLVIFPWSKVWDDSVWGDREKVASMLPDLRESFRQKHRQGCVRATQKGHTDATCSTASPLTENLKGEKVKKQQQAAGGMDAESPPSDDCRERLADPLPESNLPLRTFPGSESIRDEETLEGLSQMQTLLAQHYVRVRGGEIQALIESGLGQGLSLNGVLAFVEDKLKQKAEQNCPVYSAKLLINAIGDPADLYHWGSRASRCRSYFEQIHRHAESPFSVEALRAHLVCGARALRTLSGYEAIVAELDLLVVDIEAQFHDLEALEQHLTSLEDNVIAITLTHKTEADLTEIRRKFASTVEPYRGKMSTEQLNMMERQHRERWLLESNAIPRLSLFYLRDTECAA